MVTGAVAFGQRDICVMALPLVYVAYPATAYGGPYARRQLRVVQTLLPDAHLIDPAAAFGSTAQWRAEWPELVRQVAGVVAFGAEDAPLLDIRPLVLLTAQVVAALLHPDDERSRFLLDPERTVLLVHGFMPVSSVFEIFFLDPRAPGTERTLGTMRVPWPRQPCPACGGWEEPRPVSPPPDVGEGGFHRVDAAAPIQLVVLGLLIQGTCPHLRVDKSSRLETIRMF